MSEAGARCGCGGRIVPETRRGVEHLICSSCSVCSKCDAAGLTNYGHHDEPPVR